MRSGGPTSAMSCDRLKCKVDIIFEIFSETAVCLRDRKLVSRLMLMLSAPRETPGWSNLLGSAVRSIRDPQCYGPNVSYRPDGRACDSRMSVVKASVPQGGRTIALDVAV